MAYLDNVTNILQIQPDGLPTYVRLSQNENGRNLYFELQGNEADIPANATITISGTKPDGVVYSGTGSCTDNVVLIPETVQMTAVAGTWDAKIQITSGGNTIATGRVRFVVDADTVAPGSVPSDSELEGLVAQAQQYAETARTEAYGSPLTASTAASMTDHTRVYVYTGSESGYTAGHWYFWNGSAWTDGGIYNSVAVNTDPTLKLSGVAADAKATGDAIAAVTIETDKTLSVSDAPADAKVVGDEIASLKGDLDELDEKIDNISGLSDEAKVALLACFEKVAWIDEHGQDYYDALHDALYGSAPQWLLKWSYTDGSIPTTYAPDDWASSYGFGEFVANKGVYITIRDSGSKNLYPENYETSSDSEYELKFNFASLPTNNGLIIRLGNGTTGMQVTVNSNGISVDNSSSFLPGITIESNKDYVIKAIHSANGCSLYLDNALIWTGQSANIGNKKNHILVTISSGSMDLYISEIKFNTSDHSYWDYEWYASSKTLPDGMTVDEYDFTTEVGAMYAITPNLDFDYIGDAIIEVKMKSYYERSGVPVTANGNNPQIVIKNSIVSENVFKGVKVIFDTSLGTSQTHGMVAIGVNGKNTLISGTNSNEEYHIYSIKAQGGVYSLTIDGVNQPVEQNTQTSPYFSFTGIATSNLEYPTNFFGAFIKSIKFKKL